MDNKTLNHNENDKQIVLYDPKITQHDPKPAPPPRGSNQRHMKIEKYTVQCGLCSKWRLVPTKEKYEEIRENISEEPFVCEVAKEWKDGVCCDEPGDIEQDDTRLWAMDKPSIAQSPPGWIRELKIRPPGSSKFADVYYISPLGKRLRSTVEVQKYLDEHPEFISQGVTLSRFSFQIPKPLKEDYVRKRAPCIQASPLSWAPPTPTDPVNFQLAGTDNITAGAKKKARPSTKKIDKSRPLKLSPHNVKVEGPHPTNDVNEV